MTPKYPHSCETVAATAKNVTNAMIEGNFSSSIGVRTPRRHCNSALATSRATMFNLRARALKARSTSKRGPDGAKRNPAMKLSIEPRTVLRSVLLHASLPSPAGGGSTAAGGRGGVRGGAATPNARHRCHPTRRASRVDLPLQGRWGEFVTAAVTLLLT